MANTDLNEHVKPMVDGLKELFSTQTFSDLTIVCKGREWKVHKAIVCPQSAYFYKQCTGEFKEAYANMIEFSDNDPEVVDAVLHYLYHFDYATSKTACSMTVEEALSHLGCERPLSELDADLAQAVFATAREDLPGESTEQACEVVWQTLMENNDAISPMFLDVRVFAFADTLFIEPLKRLSAEKFALRAQYQWSTPMFAAAIKEIYDIIPEHEPVLKQTVIRIVKQHAKELFDKCKGFDDFRNLRREVADFSADIATALAMDTDEASRSTKSTRHKKSTDIAHSPFDFAYSLNEDVDHYGGRDVLNMSSEITFSGL